MIIGLISVLISLAILCPCYTAVAGRIEESLIAIRVNMPLLTLQRNICTIINCLLSIRSWNWCYSAVPFL